MADVKLVIDAETGKAIQGLLRLTNSQKQLERGMKKVGKEGKRATNQTSKLGAGIKGVAGALMGGMGVTAGIALVTKGMMQWKSYMSDIAKLAEKAGEEMVAGAMLQEKGEKRKWILKTAQMGAPYGLSMGESWGLRQAMESTAGKEKGTKAFYRVGEMKLGGMDLETAKEGMLLGIGAAQKQEPWQAAVRPYMAGELSGRDPKALIKAASSMKYWKNKTVGWAAAAVMAESGREEQLREYMSGAGLGLTKMEGKYGKLWKKLGVEGKDVTQLERLKALRKEFGEKPGIAELQAAGISEKMYAEGISDLIKGLPKIIGLEKTIRTKEHPGYIMKKRFATEKEAPEMFYKRHMEGLSREQDLLDVFGKDAEKSRKYNLEARARGTRWKRDEYEGWGQKWMIGKDKDVGIVAGVTMKYLENFFKAKWFPMQKAIEYETSPRHIEGLSEKDREDFKEAVKKLDIVADKQTATAIKTDKAMEKIIRMTAR